jgi:hypothetical protein
LPKSTIAEISSTEEKTAGQGVAVAGSGVANFLPVEFRKKTHF